MYFRPKDKLAYVSNKTLFKKKLNNEITWVSITESGDHIRGSEPPINDFIADIVVDCICYQDITEFDSIHSIRDGYYKERWCAESPRES